ncbi:MAG: flagellar hook-length control protein FliK [Oleispira sp.]|jgi:flagellar hook-length control protein FliK
MGATMEIQPTQHGLMKIFTSQGLAKDNSLTAAEEKQSDAKGFAGLLSGYFTRGGEHSLNGISSNQRPLPKMSASGEHSLNLADVADESLPLLGQALPLEVNALPLTPPVESLNILTVEPSAVLTAEPSAVLTADPSAVLTAEPSAVLTAEPSAVLTAEPSAVLTADPSTVSTAAPLTVSTAAPLTVSTVDPSTVLTVEDTKAKGQSLAKSVSEDDLLTASNIDAASNDNDVTTPLLEDQGFYVQSLVSSLIGSSAIAGSGVNVSAVTKLHNTHTASLSGESAKAVSVTAQKLENGINLQNLSASELEVIGDEAPDRFLGSESLLTPLKSKKSVALEPMPAPQSIAPPITATAQQSQVSLALALNEDPTTQSLGDLVDGEALEKGELETKSNTLERKQDDQTLKLSKGQQAWGDAITERITMNAAKDIKQVTIHLDPPELGSLELKLQIKDDQQTHVQVQVQNPQVKEALESSAHRLREMLANQGLELSEFDVQTDSGRGESSQYGSDDQGQGQSQNSDTSEHSTEEISMEVSKAKNNNLLDTFV